MLRSFRKLIAQIGVVAMLLSQLAVAAYACPTMKSVNCGEASMAMDSASAGEPTSDLPALCQKHCQNDQQSYGDLLSPLISVALAPSFVVTLDVAPGPNVVLPAAYHALLHAASPPLTIRNCCFRI